MKHAFAITAFVGLLAAGVAQAQTTVPGGPAAPSTAPGVTTTAPRAGMGTNTTGSVPAMGAVNPAAPQRNSAAPAAVSTTTSNTRTPAAPVPGANSYTEGEARGHIADKGFSNVQGLKKDAQGVWRGTAMKDGKQVNVALDYQGNVVSQ